VSSPSSRFVFRGALKIQVKQFGMPMKRTGALLRQLSLRFRRLSASLHVGHLLVLLAAAGPDPIRKFEVAAAYQGPPRYYACNI